MKKILIALALASLIGGTFMPATALAECPPAGCGLNSRCNEELGQCEPLSTTPQPDAGPKQRPVETFVPLTSIPGVNAVASSADLPAFLNNLYMIAVGAAAVLAVLQIVRSGITYMLSDAGVTEKRDAKKHILMSVLGLVLVLSPALVFGIINPDILNLRINLSGLQPGELESGTGTTPEGSVGDPLSTGNGVTAGTRLSCLYSRNYTNPAGVPGLQGNRPATVLEDESETEDPFASPNNLLLVRFDADPAPRYVAAGDCSEPREAPTPTPAVEGAYSAGQTISCYYDNYGFISGTVVSHTSRGITFAWQSSGGRAVTPNIPRNKCYAAGEPVPEGVCGAVPNCSTGCQASGDTCVPI